MMAASGAVELTRYTLDVALNPSDVATLPVAIAHMTQALCEKLGRDPADGTMALLTAAVYVAMRHTDKPPPQLADILADSLGSAIVCAADWYRQ